MGRSRFEITVFNNRTGAETKWLKGTGGHLSAVERAMELSKLDKYWERFDYLYSTKELKRDGAITIENYWTKVTIERL